MGWRTNMKNLICIVCPNSCHLTVDETTLKVTGNQCLRGVQFATAELTHPMRTLTTTVRTNLHGILVVAVKTTSELPKGLIFKAMEVINRQTVHEYLPSGSIVIKNILETGVDVITTATLKKE